MAFDPNLPANNSPLDAAEVRNQFNGLKTIIDAGNVPMGCVLAYLKSFPATPVLPASWVECNGQVLNDVASPYHGATLPNLNGASGGPQYFLRGATTSGNTTGSDEHSHMLDVVTEENSPNVDVDNTLAGSTTFVAVGPHNHNLTGQPTNLASTLPTNYEVVWVMRVK